MKLEYSIDSGNTYNLIATTPNTGAYSWTVPNTPSTKVFIKASNATGSTISDVNNAVFKIEKPTNFLTSPNGGENWRPLNTYNITWDNTKFISSVKLEYSLNNGTTWTTITNSASNSGTYAWLVPAPPTVMPTNQALIRITNVTVSAIMDTSNATFNIIDRFNFQLQTQRGHMYPAAPWELLGLHQMDLIIAAV
ncbi:MAG: hypothetical protein IPK03_10325 [Bacteroidetes bacterium]|nr:hypothetical protein [Bacteroidota bacterium]